MSKHHVIYIPGIGDHKPYYQPQILSIWRLYGVSVHYHPVIWRSQNESWNAKLKKINSLVNQLYEQKLNVSLVGVSAGASAALNVYAANKEKISSVVYVCGKLQHPETIVPAYYGRNPAFKESLLQAQDNMRLLEDKDKSKMLSLRPIYDQTVPVEHTKIPGVRSFTMLSAYHTPSIFAGIVFYAPIICKFIRMERR